MSISATLNNALSGLTAVTRQANVVSSNVSNALTEGYGRREVELASRSSGAGGGVSVVAVRRMVDLTVLTDRREADADAARSDVQAQLMASVLDSIGEPGTGVSLGDRIAAVEAALVSSAARPEQASRHVAVVESLRDLTGHIRSVSDTIQTERSRADGAIHNAVQRMNGLLDRIAELNTDIRRYSVSSESPNALLDERQRLVDEVAEMVPVREVDRGNGTIALMTPGGMLLDGPAPTLEFTHTSILTPHHSLSNGSLSGLSIDGQPVDMTRSPGMLSGGSLEGLFAVRDTVAPQVQTQLDAVARDLLERFQTTGVDPTLPPGAPGLLTDSGGAFLAANEVGLAERLEINTLVDPDAGGAAWRLRDGLGATVQGDVGQSAGLVRLSGALTGTRVPASGGLTSGAETAAGFSASFLSAVGVSLEIMESDSAYANARSSALTEEALADGVDTDQEMQNLLRIEQAYAANARVIQTVETMIDALLRM